MPIQDNDAASIEALVESIMAVSEDAAESAAKTIATPSHLSISVQALAAAARRPGIRRAIVLAAARIEERDRG